jgi:hypothetical protein
MDVLWKTEEGEGVRKKGKRKRNIKRQNRDMEREEKGSRAVE